MFRKFKPLNIPDGWQQYWSKYPNGYTIMEALIDWVSQVDDMVKNQNELTDTVKSFGERIDEFINQFGAELQKEVQDLLTEWQDSGFLNIVISEALQWELDNYIATNEQDKLSINDQLQAIDERVKHEYVTPEMFGAVGDGVTDDYESLRQCFLADTHKIVLGEGKTYVTSLLELHLSKADIVEGNGSEIKLMDNSGQLGRRKDSGANFVLWDKFIIIDKSNTTIRNLTLNANIENNFFTLEEGSQYDGKYYGYHPDVGVPSLPNIYITINGIYAEGVSDILIEECHFHDLGNAIGVGGGPSGGDSVRENLTISNCYFYNGFRDQIYIFQYNDVMIDNCKFHNNQRKGVQLYQNTKRATILRSSFIVDVDTIRKWYPTWATSQPDAELSGIAFGNPNYFYSKYNTNDNVVEQCYFEGLKSSVRLRNYSINLAVKTSTFKDCIETILFNAGVRGLVEVVGVTFDNCERGVNVSFTKRDELPNGVTNTYECSIRISDSVVIAKGQLLHLNDTYGKDYLYKLMDITLVNNRTYSSSSLIEFVSNRVEEPEQPFLSVRQLNNTYQGNLIQQQVDYSDKIIVKPIEISAVDSENGYSINEQTGLMTQWGVLRDVPNSSQKFINFPKPFSERVLTLQTTFSFHDVNGNPISPTSFTKESSLSQFQIRYSSSGTPTHKVIYWLALGI